MSTSPDWKRGFSITRVRKGAVVVTPSMMKPSSAMCIRRMQMSLESFIIEGVTTTIPFLARVMQNRRFQSGDVDTKFLEREPDLMKEPG